MSIEVQIVGKALSRSIRDLFSPVTELAGAIGDQVRIYREIAVLNTLKRAKFIAQKKNLKLKPPPLKFFVPFLEDCSLENQDDSVISEMWANLLVSASSDYSPQHNLFLRILREITKREAEALEHIATRRNTETPTRVSLLDAESSWYDTAIYIKIQGLIEMEENRIDEIKYDKFEKNLKERIESAGAVVTYFSVCRGNKGEYPLDEIHGSKVDSTEKKFDYMSFNMLRSLGLIERYKSQEFWFGDHEFQVHSLYITELGASFYLACTSQSEYTPKQRRNPK